MMMVNIKLISQLLRSRYVDNITVIWGGGGCAGKVEEENVIICRYKSEVDHQAASEVHALWTALRSSAAGN